MGRTALRAAPVAVLILFPARLVLASDASSKMPDIGSLLTDVKRNQAQVEKWVEDYTCHKFEQQNTLDSNGQVHPLTTTEFEVFYLYGHEVDKRISKNGRPLDAAQQRREQERVDKEVRKYAAERESGQPARHHHQHEIDVSTFLRVARFTNPRRENYRGAMTIAFDFIGNPDYHPANAAESLLQKLGGTLWVDEQAHQVVRLEAHLNDSLKIGGGLLASLQRGSNFVFEQARVNNEVWLPSDANINYWARLLLFKGARGNVTLHYRDYQKFRVESVIKPVTQ
jgi:hypothetical protein